MVIDMTEPKNTNTKPLTKAVIESTTAESPVVAGTPELTGLPTETIAPVNHTQTDEFYELPAVSNVPAAPKEEEIAPVPEVTNDTVDLSEHKTGLPSNTTGGQLDIAIDRFHKLQAEAVADPDTVAAKLDLLSRLDVLHGEANQLVANKIALIRAAL
jgi:hypothetical protein